MSVQTCIEPKCQRRADPGAIELLIEARVKDLGDFQVRRLLPASERQRVGPFIFFDHMGPTRFAAGQAIDVRPHPHIGLATVTYLFDGVIRHRDSLGSVQDITSGAVNWMTAGRGIVHSERTPEEMRAGGSNLHGLQIWLALPLEAEESAPAFVHHPASSIPRIEKPGAKLALVAGTAYGIESPVRAASPMFYVAGELDPGAGILLPDDHAERAVYVVDGEPVLDGQALAPGSMAVLREGAHVRLHSGQASSRVALVGGAPLAGERHLWWNFVSSSLERIERAKSDWKDGRFPLVPGETELIPLPER
jgi:redox-sensitive bicupin YhaK (pirin superfamily)